MTIKNLYGKLSLSPSLRRGLGVGLFLLVGSVSLVAQSSGDPFGEVNYRKYANNMSLTALVYMDGNALGNETVVAAYCGEELRGKDSPIDDAGYTTILYLDIYGDNRGDKLHFKVSTEARVIEVDQGLTYASDDIIGSPEAPYIIDLPVPVVTTPSTEGWATTCVPFNAEVPDGVTVWNVTGIEQGELTMSKVEGNILPKDTPVLLYSDGKANYEWLSRVADGDMTMTSSILKGTTAETTVTASSVMTLGHSNETGEIGFWLYTGTEIPANRAYIADFPTNARGFAIHADGTTTGIGATLNDNGQMINDKFIYDLQGRRTNARPSLWKKNEKGQIIIIR